MKYWKFKCSIKRLKALKDFDPEACLYMSNFSLLLGIALGLDIALLVFINFIK